MNRNSIPSSVRGSRSRGGMAAFLVGLLAAVSAMPASSVDIATKPLSIGREIPGNLALVPSVEYPTIISQANIGDYDVGRTYKGYFAADRCYAYRYSATETERYFEPVAVATNRTCSGAGQWSGNYLAWAATQTIDPFRLALTGGYRVKDTASETWLEKARHHRGDLYPNRSVPSSNGNSGLVDGATPAAWDRLSVRIHGLGNKMYFTRNGDLNNPARTVLAYDPSVHLLTDTVTNGVHVDGQEVYEVSVRVKVCVPIGGAVESHCRQYSGAWKPEGLIQEYAENLRYSIFGYLNDSSNARDGGVLRARQKFVGNQTYYPDATPAANPAREWDPSTGVLYTNPDAADATATGGGVANSGVINYLNRFGQMTDWAPKSLDPVSELYYAAVRYFKNQGNVAAYSTFSGDVYHQADGFPVITNWDDPIRYSCQTNVILGIGDVYTHDDKNLPGNTHTQDEPATPSEVTADTTVNVVTATQKVFDLEGLGTLSNPFTGRENSAYIAGLAYDSNTQDIRPDDASLPQTRGRQSVQTHWVDVRENQVLEPKRNNQYWLAAKYGGFRVPSGFNAYTRTQALDPAWWHTSNEYLTSGNGGGITTTVNTYPRPDNFYVASEADKMVASLRQAFENIIRDMRGSGGSFASNTTKLETGAMTYQAQFFTGSWAGELVGYNVNQSTGALTQAWTASSNFPAWASRKIYTNSGSTRQNFTAANVPGLTQQVVDYIRGDRSNEQPAGSLRQRQGVLGDIVNSQPVYVAAPNPRLFYGAEFTGATGTLTGNGSVDYGQFAQAKAGRTPVIYVGANDGMLHGFNATTGVETVAYIPSQIIPRLANLASPTYQHEYFVDGDLTVADAYLNGQWRTILVGTLGRGGKGVFALDVTDPANVSVLWEKTATDIPALGNVLGKPIIAQVANGDWRVFMGNGPNSTGGTAQLVSIRLDTGAVTTVSTGASGDNGLSAVNVWASGATDFADTIYAGDLQGNLWKFTGLAGTMTATSIFQANRGGVAQPITAAPMVSRNPSNRDLWIHFGTGRYLGEADLADESVQTWYGIIDSGTAVTRADLEDVAIEAEATLSNGMGARVVEAITGPVTRGWYIDLVSPVNGVEGERMVVPNIFQGLSLIGTTRIPDNTDVCNPSGRGWVMAINPFTGGRLNSSFFDVNGDGRFDNNDQVNGQPASGIGLPSGPNNPIFIGNVMLTNMDNAESNVIKTNSSVLAPSRVSWREVVGD